MSKIKQGDGVSGHVDPSGTDNHQNEGGDPGKRTIGGMILGGVVMVE